ncbi:hypothetical protein, partial [Thiomonas sp.]|uniref:hypothetical protein n=1 Tax=Thiomonas sp. TaxID=2047785 RepID=UPI00260F4C2A
SACEAPEAAGAGIDAGAATGAEAGRLAAPGATPAVEAAEAAWGTALEAAEALGAGGVAPPRMRCTANTISTTTMTAAPTIRPRLIQPRRF